MKEKWSHLKKQLQNLVTKEVEEDEEEEQGAPAVESRPYILKEDALRKLKTAARRKNIPLDTALAQAVERYIQNTEQPTKPKISEERKELNPLLRLEGLATRSLQKLPKGGTQHGNDEATYNK